MIAEEITRSREVLVGSLFRILWSLFSLDFDLDPSLGVSLPSLRSSLISSSFKFKIRAFTGSTWDLSSSRILDSYNFFFFRNSRLEDICLLSSSNWTFIFMSSIIKRTLVLADLFLILSLARKPLASFWICILALNLLADTRENDLRIWMQKLLTRFGVVSCLWRSFFQCQLLIFSCLQLQDYLSHLSLIRMIQRGIVRLLDTKATRNFYHQRWIFPLDSTFFQKPHSLLR